MNTINKILILFVSIYLVACSPPDGLIGKWEVFSQECLLKDKSRTFKDIITKERKYTLEFMKEDQVQLTYPDLDISADLIVDKQATETEKIKCDTTFTGKYYYTMFGNIQFDFADDDTGAYQAKKGQKCETELEIKFKAMPKSSPYKNDPAVSLKKMEGKELQLAFPDFTKCKDDKMIIVFKKK